MTDSHALLIGASRGLGRAVAWHLSTSVPRISVLSRNPPAPGALPPSTHHRCADITDPAATSAALTSLIQSQGPPSRVLFFQRHRGPASATDWDSELAVSLGATRRIVEELAESHSLRDAALVFVSSVNATLVSPPLPPAYHVAKAGLVQLARYYAATLGHRGIRVNTVSPGTFLKDESRDAFLSDPARVAHHQQATALHRIGTAAEVAKAIGFLSGPEASFITGHDLVVDGGASLRYQETLTGPPPAAGA